MDKAIITMASIANATPNQFNLVRDSLKIITAKILEKAMIATLLIGKTTEPSQPIPKAFSKK